MNENAIQFERITFNFSIDYDDVTRDNSKVENDFWYKDVSEILGTLIPPREEFISIYGRLLVRKYCNVGVT